MTIETGPLVWARYQEAKTAHERQRILIAARKALVTAPGVAPEMWPFYPPNDAGIAAAHITAGIWATHQTAGHGRGLVHVPVSDGERWRPNFGAACRLLFNEKHTGSEQVRSPIDTLADDSISKRLAALSRAEEQDIAAGHITSLVRLMCSTGKLISFNYDDLFWAIRDWSAPDKHARTMSRWSRSYFHTQPKATETKSVAEEG